MNRNVESHFGEIPSKNIKRSTFKRDCSHKTTFNTGDIIPIYRDEVLPGDTVKLRLSELVRMTTPINPVMDNAWLDTYFFFIPRRLVWEHWKEFMGENTTDAWTQETEYTIPQLEAPEGGWQKGSIASYLGARIGVDGISIDACYTRAYALCYNEWFRNQNVSEPAEITLGDATTTGSNGTDYVVDIQKGGMPAKAVKYADYFTRALPEPQKGPDVYIPITGQVGSLTGSPTISGSVGIAGNGKAIGLTDNTYNYGTISLSNNGLTINSASFDTNIGAVGQAGSYTGTPNGVTMGIIQNENYSGITGVPHLTADMTPVSVDLSNLVPPTINELRQAYAIQKMYEIDARGGTRYTEIIRAHFGVLSPDGRQQRPEYLGGKRVPINMTQVIQQSQTDNTPLGDTAGMSLTIDTHDMFTKSFTEHGIILGLAVIRTEHTYQQGIDRILTRKNRFDFYFPTMANIGEQYIKEKEIFAQGTGDDEDAFGYQEAWAEYRYGINRISGELNSDYTYALDSWTYADDYSQAPTLTHDWMVETDTNMARTLAIQNQDQFVADFYFDQTWTRPMPIYSVPGLTGWY